MELLLIIQSQLKKLLNNNLRTNRVVLPPPPALHLPVHNRTIRQKLGTLMSQVLPRIKLYLISTGRYSLKSVKGMWVLPLRIVHRFWTLQEPLSQTILNLSRSKVQRKIVMLTIIHHLNRIVWGRSSLQPQNLSKLIKKQSLKQNPHKTSLGEFKHKLRLVIFLIKSLRIILFLITLVESYRTIQPHHRPHHHLQILFRRIQR